MLEGTTLCANSVSTLKKLKSEKIAGVLNLKTTKYDFDKETPYVSIFVFESGFSFWLRSTGAFWFENIDDTKKIIKQEMSRREKIIEDIKSLKGLKNLWKTIEEI